jgi:hypothetical protein
MIKRGSWVQIERTILEPAERAPQVPDDTKEVPLIMWVKGFLKEDGNVGDEVEIITRTGRIEAGKLLAVNPQYELNYGNFVPELLDINIKVREELFGSEQVSGGA